MTKKSTEQTLAKGYFKPDGDDWYDIAMGTFVGTCLYGASGVLVMMKLGIPKRFYWVYMFFVAGLIIYRYWREGQIKIVETGLTKNENLNLLRGVFNQLNWSTYESSDEILIRDNKYVLKFIRMRLIYSENLIGYNFQYSSNEKSGRPAFFFGVLTILKNRFEKELKVAMEQRAY